MSPEIPIAGETSNNQPVLIFHVNAWKAKRWGERLSHSDDVNKVFIHQSPNSIAATIAEILKENGLSNTDIINIVPMEPPAHARVDIGSMELWMFCRNPKFGAQTAQPISATPSTVWQKPIVRDGITIQPLVALIETPAQPPEKSAKQILKEQREKKHARRTLLRSHTNRQVYVPYPTSESMHSLVPAVLKGRDSNTSSGVVVKVSCSFNDTLHRCATNVFTEIPADYRLIEVGGWKGAYVKINHPLLKKGN